MIKQITTFCIGLAILAGFSQAQDASTPAPVAGKKALIAYFSATGTTAAAAKELAEATGGALHAITPAQPYSEADLNWRDKNSRCYVEMHDPAARPALKAETLNLAEYDTVYIGFPIWWDTYPSIIATFIESHDLKGKTLIPFATSGGSSISNSGEMLKKAYPTLQWKPGMLLNGMSSSEIRAGLK